ncbi:hypothetical protein D3S17_20205 [Salmonella enterica]|nr:hypothetical protein [Salmonella enterica]EAU3551033.1 hypothetical protein [Salmonella enterica]EBL2873030.1 hypothetical protein [Salmonella enterica]ESH02401.1 hypothetical protein SEEGA711_28380 [Salmonella enterica subsp. enterica serovar Gaminara str. ATCC BAA-711]
MAEFIYPLDDDTAVLRTALRVRTHRVMASPDEQDAHARHVGTAWRHQNAGRFIAGMVKAARPERSQQA